MSKVNSPTGCNPETENSEQACRTWIGMHRAAGYNLTPLPTRNSFKDGRIYREMSPDQRTFLRQNRRAIFDLLRSESTVDGAVAQTREPGVAGPLREPWPTAEPAAPAAVEPERRHPPAEEDIRAAMADVGDRFLHDYLAGRIDRPTAFAVTRQWMRKMRELRDALQR
jgi:hypothetical protein